MHAKTVIFKIVMVTISFISVCIIGVLDYLTGAELSFSIFYFFPIGLISWYYGLYLGGMISLFSAVVWYFADILARPEPYGYSFIPLWNSGVRLITFLIISILLHEMRKNLDRESTYARIDYLTGAANTRAFFEAAKVQISIIKRNNNPFSIIYLDVDNLKKVNDKFGHIIGDKVLKETVTTIKRVLRPNDTVARIGGDEFVVLISDAESHVAEIITLRIQLALRQGLGKQYPITYSIGVLTCSSEPKSIDELLVNADNLMYEAKKSGKDTIKFA
jgi:diguanylate cyclase (GGDEF)-like protein